MNKDRLIGSDASLYKMSFGAALVTGTMTSGSWYKIAAVSGTTVFEAGFSVGDLYLGNGKTLTATNSASLASPTIVADASGFDMAFSRDEIEVTVLADDIKKYRPGKTDLSGTVRGINFISEMNKAGSIMSRFIRSASATAGNVSTFRGIDGTELYGQFYVQDDTTTSGETQAFLFGQIELYGYNLGAAIGDAQAWESGMRFIGADPIMYFKANS
jgi:hypothetical protein